MSKKKLTFTGEAKKALDILEKSSKNLFLTGKAGTGKSTLLEYFRGISEKRGAVLAPTGTAAINVDGETIHAFFGLKPGFEKAEAVKISKNPKNPSLYKRIEILIIDEISMVRADLVDAMDIFLRNARRNPDPFGGVQIVFIGDLYQLPPVITKDDEDVFYKEYGYKSPYFFDAEVFRRTDFSFEFIELQKIYRQSDNNFIHLLNKVRTNSLSHEDFSSLNSRVQKHFSSKEIISLCTTNKAANAINQKNLNALSGSEFFSESTVTGEVEYVQYPADNELFLKQGAQVIFLNNDPKRRWVNGSIGKVVEILEEKEKIKVEIGEKIETVEKNLWEISKYVIEEGKLKRKTLGGFEQFPLRLAWAITIHKSQGKTFKNVNIDLGWGSFTHGQTYVALSRCESFEGMSFTRKIQKKDIIMDEKILKFMSQFDIRLSGKFFPQKNKMETFQSAIDSKKTTQITLWNTYGDISMLRFAPEKLEEKEHNGKNFWAIKGNIEGEEKIFSLPRILSAEIQTEVLF